MAEVPNSFNGVSFTEEQKALIQKDLDLIDKLYADIDGINGQYASAENNIIEAKEKLNTECAGIRVWNRADEIKKQNCVNKWNGIWDSNRGIQSSLDSQRAQKNQQIEAAKKNYNDDLDAIQNTINFQIQANLANQANNTQNAQNQVALNQNDPRVLLIKAQAEANQKLKALELQSTLDKQKRESQIKVAGLIFITICVIGVGFYFIKKVF